MLWGIFNSGQLMHKVPTYIKVNGCFYRRADPVNDDERARLDQQEEDYAQGSEDYRDMLAEMTPEERRQFLKQHPQPSSIEPDDYPPEKIINIVRQQLKAPDGFHVARDLFLMQAVSTRSLQTALKLMEEKNDNMVRDHQELVDRFLYEVNFMHEMHYGPHNEKR